MSNNFHQLIFCYFFKLLLLPWLKKDRKSTSNLSNYRVLFRPAYFWIQTWVWNCKTNMPITFNARAQILSSFSVLITSNYCINGIICSVQKCCKVHVFSLPRNNNNNNMYKWQIIIIRLFVNVILSYSSVKCFYAYFSLSLWVLKK